MLRILNNIHNNTLFLIDNVIRFYFDLPFGTFFVVTFIMLFIGIPLFSFMYFVLIIEIFIIMEDSKAYFATQSANYLLGASIALVSALVGIYFMIYSIIFRFTPAEFFASLPLENNVEPQILDDPNQDIFIEPESMNMQPHLNNSRSRRSAETYRERRERRPPRFRTSRIIFQEIEKHSEETQRQVAELYYKYLLHYNDSKLNSKNGMNKFKREILYRYGRDQYDPTIVTTFKRYRNSVLEQDYTQYLLVKTRYKLSDCKQKIPKLQEIIRSKINVYGTPQMKADLDIIDDHLKYINNNKKETKIESNSFENEFRKRVKKSLKEEKNRLNL